MNSIYKRGGRCEHCGERVPGTDYFSDFETCDTCVKILADHPALASWVEKTIKHHIEQAFASHAAEQEEQETRRRDRSED